MIDDDDLIDLRRSGALDPMYMPCGGVAEFDRGSMCAHRCTTCNAVIGSMGQPRVCKELQERYDAWGLLGGKGGGWDYRKGMPKSASEA